jgi:hypothetical protein
MAVSPLDGIVMTPERYDAWVAAGCPPIGDDPVLDQLPDAHGFRLTPAPERAE